MLSRIFKFLPVIALSIIAGCEQMGVQPDEDNTPPKAGLSISPTIGDSTTSFVLRGGASRDLEDIQDFLEFRWDFNNDSVWDTEYRAYSALIKHFPTPGTYTIRMEVKDRHGLTDQAVATLKSYGFNDDTSHFLDPRDGQSYRMVRIGEVWWMAENLNYGTMIRDTQKASDNGIFEKYCYKNDPSLKSVQGGYYTYYDWDEIIGYDTSAVQGLCPPGWKLPDRIDWDTLRNPYRSRGVDYFSEGGFSGLNLTKTGIHELTKFWEPLDECICSSFWMYFTRDFTKDFYRRGYRPCPYVISSRVIRTVTKEDVTLVRFVNDSIAKNGGALPVRCIKINP